MTWDNFKVSDFACKCGCGTNLIQSSFVDKLQWLRTETGIVMPVNSGYRCPKHNTDVSTTGPTGPHTTGRAADFGVRGEKGLDLLCAARASGKFTGFGVHQRGGSRFIHLDDLPNGPGCPRPAFWTY